jgi:gliding motility-associated lipoprotein GldH
MLFKKLLIPLLFLASCQTIDLYEKVQPIPGHKWRSSYKPSFSFNIKDTTRPYQLYIILRHTEKYNYNNIWVNLHVRTPDSVQRSFLLELPLATNEKGWLGSGIDDVYEHRIALTLDPEKLNFKKAGDYQFTLEHIMRQDPLEYVMNAGIRIEKK